MFVIHNLQDFAKSPWAQYLKHLKPISDMISDQSFIIIFFISKAILMLTDYIFTLRRWALWPI